MGTVVVNHAAAGTPPSIGTGAGDAAAGNHPHAQLAALVADYNARRNGMHLFPNGVVSHAAATNLATSITLANTAKGAFTSHVINTTGLDHTGMHIGIDDENMTVEAPNATDQGTLTTLLLELCSRLGNHVGYGVHYSNVYPDIGALAPPEPTDEATSVVYANFIRTRLTEHFNSARLADGAEI